jgi:cytidine deaminase
MIEEIRIQYNRLNLEDLSQSEQEMVRRAREVSERAYAPYSKFKVGAAAILENGEVILGSNQENIAFPSGLCAERVALFAAGANYPEIKVESLVIVAKGELLKPGAVLSPCGSCRQVMCETENRQEKPFRVVLVSEDGVVTVFNSASDLLPLTFGK